MKKVLPAIMILALIVVGGGSFYGGMKYGQSKNSRGPRNSQDFRNMSADQRQQAMQQGGFQGRGNRQGGAGFTDGEIISKDDKSVTIKLRNGGSKIVFYSDSTKVTRSVDGKAADLKVGESLMVSGDANQDGSITAKTIQQRPADANTNANT